MLALKDRVYRDTGGLDYSSSWPKIVVAVFAAWLTITASLHVFLSQDTPGQGRSASRKNISSNPLHRTAHEKFEAWAKAHPPNDKTKKQVVSSLKTTPNAPPVRRQTAKEKLESYAKASQARNWSSAPKPAPLKPQEPKLRKTAREKIEAYANSHQALTQRQKFEDKFPTSDEERIRSFIASRRTSEIDDGIRQSIKHLPFDPFDCPETPPKDYPFEYSLVEILQEWPVDQLKWPASDQVDTTTHPYLYQSLCVFDWERPEHRERIRRYQVLFDVPFVLRNQPEFKQASERWLQPEYLKDLVGVEPQKTEHSFHSNHLPYWKTGLAKPLPPDWKEPTEITRMTYAEWSQRADSMTEAIAKDQDHTKMDHYYFRLDAKGDRLDPHAEQQNAYLFDEFPVFDPRLSKDGENLFMLHPTAARGINCRFGMAGNVAEAHFDMSSNWITLLGGHRRYILSHPRECANLSMHPLGHPSARHSSANWSDITQDSESTAATRALAKASANQVVLQASDALYLPTNWLHFIVSLDRNYQCNARSGIRHEYDQGIRDCGFARLLRS